MTFMVSYGNQLRLYIHIIQWVDYHKSCLKAQGTRFLDSGFYNRLNMEKIMVGYFVM